MSSRVFNGRSNDPGDPFSSIRRNHRIKASTVAVVSQDGKQLGVMLTSDAIMRALELNLDLVELDPDAVPPVCRIMDFQEYVRSRGQEPPDQGRPSMN